MRHGCTQNPPVGGKLPAGETKLSLCQSHNTSHGHLGFRACQISSASQSLSSLAGSQMSPLGPSPCQRTLYCILLGRLRSSTILSMKCSCSPSIVTGSGGWRAHPGKSVSLFSWNGWISEVWNIGKAYELVPRSNVTVECFSLVESIL